MPRIRKTKRNGTKGIKWKAFYVHSKRYLSNGYVFIGPPVKDPKQLHAIKIKIDLIKNGRSIRIPRKTLGPLQPKNKQFIRKRFDWRINKAVRSLRKRDALHRKIVESEDRKKIQKIKGSIKSKEKKRNN